MVENARETATSNQISQINLATSLYEDLIKRGKFVRVEAELESIIKINTEQLGGDVLGTIRFVKTQEARDNLDELLKTRMEIKKKDGMPKTDYNNQNSENSSGAYPLDKCCIGQMPLKRPDFIYGKGVRLELDIPLKYIHLILLGNGDDQRDFKIVKKYIVFLDEEKVTANVVTRNPIKETEIKEYLSGLGYQKTQIILDNWLTSRQANLGR